MGTTPPLKPAESYETFYGPAIFAPAAAILLEYADPRPGENVLDLACGTGMVARHVAPRVGSGGRITAVDLNPAMLEVGRALPPPPGAPIDWREGDAVDVALPQAHFHLALCQHGLQFFPDRGAALANVHGALRPGGRLALSVWQGMDRNTFFRDLAEIEVRHLASVGVTREEVEAPFSMHREQVVDLLHRAGFRDTQVAERSIEARFPSPDTFIRNMELAYAAVIPEFVDDPGAFEAFVDGVEAGSREVVRSHVRGDHVVVPMHMWVVTARA